MQSPSNRFSLRVAGWLGVHSSWSMLHWGQVIWSITVCGWWDLWNHLSQQIWYSNSGHRNSVGDDWCHSKGYTVLPSWNPRFSNSNKVSSKDNMPESRKTPKCRLGHSRRQHKWEASSKFCARWRNCQMTIGLIMTIFNAAICRLLVHYINYCIILNISMKLVIRNLQQKFNNLSRLYKCF